MADPRRGADRQAESGPGGGGHSDTAATRALATNIHHGKVTRQHKQHIYTHVPNTPCAFLMLRRKHFIGITTTLDLETKHFKCCNYWEGHVHPNSTSSLQSQGTCKNMDTGKCELSYTEEPQ